MSLKSVYISQYKNLEDFTLNFDSNSFIDVFVGKNGTGKSNLFEALSEIFRNLYERSLRSINYYASRLTMTWTIVVAWIKASEAALRAS